MTTHTNYILTILIALLFCSCGQQKNDTVDNNANQTAQTDSAKLAPKELTNLLDAISSQLRIQRLSKLTPHIENVLRFEYRITFLPGGCGSTNNGQGVLFSIVLSNYIRDTLITHFKGIHFGYAKKRPQFKIDTIFKTIDVDVPFDIYSDFTDIAYGAYLDDQVEYHPTGDATPDDFFIERHFNDYKFGTPKVDYKLIIKGQARSGNFNDMLKYGMEFAGFEWKKNYR